MKKDLLIGGLFAVLAILGVGVVVTLLNSSEEENAAKTIKPKPEPIALLPHKAVKEEPKKTVPVVRVIPIQPVRLEPKKEKPEPLLTLPKKAKLQKEAPLVIAKVDLANKKEEKLPDVKKIDVKIEPKEKTVALDLIEFGETKKLNRPQGEYTVPVLEAEEKIILVGKVKLLKLSGATGKAIIDASQLDAQEIVWTGDVNGEARVKLYAPRGTVHLQAQINGSAQVEISAPDGKVILKSRSHTIVSGGARVSIVAKEIELNGEIGGGAHVGVTLSKEGSLKFSKLQEGARLHYNKTDASDPEPRLIRGPVLGGAQVRKMEPAKK